MAAGRCPEARRAATNRSTRRRRAKPGIRRGPPETYRARYWLRVRLKPFQPLRPGQRRLMATFDGFLAALAWDNTLMAATVLEAAREMERIYRETMDATKG